jgi:hypothetical protein
MLAKEAPESVERCASMSPHTTTFGWTIDAQSVP